ncbi:protein INCA1 isoform X3 [Mus musculus]|uniref:protein INCA1 isoform X3 n=2 Tax=Mus musculus TaxID=10090 RepID=UPI0003D6E09C|nr:protein INCA1 isoform X3 [Mus musculus]|eukprot:XP_017169701.1 PREDICTED: protein INCA1 isoform X3 [Mus musculus]
MQGQEDGDSILPFAKCSRVVSRFSPCSLPPQNRRPMPQPYGDAFWENLSQRSRLKRAQWGSSDATPELPALEEGFELLSTTKYFDVEEERATYPQKETYSVTPRDQLLWTPWTPVGQQGTYASGQLSSLTYSTATARKNPVYDPQAMELESEE